jgi:hypothetical protein
MMFSSNAFRFVPFLFLSLSANAETVRGARRELVEDQNPVPLGTARNYAILAKTGISTVPNSAITGNIAVSPIKSEAMTGFSFTLDSYGLLSESTQITKDDNFVGKAFAPNLGGSEASALLTTAVSDMEAAYNNTVSRSTNDGARINLEAGLLTAVTLTPGVYTFTTDVHLTGDIYFDGSDSEIFIIQMTGSLMQDANYNVILLNGALAKNIFWQVAGQVTVGAGAHMEGVLLVKNAVTFVTGSSLNGRVLSQTACNLQMATIVQPFESVVESRI